MGGLHEFSTHGFSSRSMPTNLELAIDSMIRKNVGCLLPVLVVLVLVHLVLVVVLLVEVLLIEVLVVVRMSLPLGVQVHPLGEGVPTICSTAVLPVKSTSVYLLQVLVVVPRLSNSLQRVFQNLVPPVHSSLLQWSFSHCSATTIKYRL